MNQSLNWYLHACKMHEKSRQRERTLALTNYPLSSICTVKWKEPIFSQKLQYYVLEINDSQYYQKHPSPLIKLYYQRYFAHYKYDRTLPDLLDCSQVEY